MQIDLERKIAIAHPTNPEFKVLLRDAPEIEYFQSIQPKLLSALRSVVVTKDADPIKAMEAFSAQDTAPKVIEALRSCVNGFEGLADLHGDPIQFGEVAEKIGIKEPEPDASLHFLMRKQFDYTEEVPAEKEGDPPIVQGRYFWAYLLSKTMAAYTEIPSGKASRTV